MESFEEVYQKYLKEVYCFLLRLSGDREIAEELTQQTFAIAFEKLENFRGECKLSVWLCQIAKHEYYAWTKKQKRYANKKDQASMLKQQEEMNMVYDKYGLKMSSGCLPSLLQLVFLFGLYPVVQNIPEYVTKVRNVYIPLVEKIQATTGYEKIMSSLATGLVPGAESLDYTKAGNMIEVMYKFQSSTWNELVDKMPKLESVVNNTMSEVSHLNNFLGVDIGAHPWNLLTDALAAASIVSRMISTYSS